MTAEALYYAGCIDMFHTQEGQIAQDYDFAEDALDFQGEVLESGAVSYSLPLAEPLRPGSHIVCSGTPTDDLPWFAVNLCCPTAGAAAGGATDIAVHFNARVPQQYVVRNTRRRRTWGVEETTAHVAFPFKVGRRFAVEVLVEATETLWAVDGQHYCSYAHRAPSALAATSLQVVGVRDAELRVARAAAYPELAPPPLSVSSRLKTEMLTTDEGPAWTANSVATLPEGVPPGRQIIIYGRLRKLLHSFTVEVCGEGGERVWPRADVLLHVDVRARDGAPRSRQLVVLNSWRGGWGPERRQRSASLVPGLEVCVRLVARAEEWQVWAGRVLVGSLEHRVALGRARVLRLRGDLAPRDVFVAPADAPPPAADA